MLERACDLALDAVERRHRRVAGIDAAEHEKLVAIGLEDRGVVVAARELDGEAGNPGLHQASEQLRISVMMLQLGTAGIAVAEMHHGRHRYALQAAVERTRPI